MFSLAKPADFHGQYLAEWTAQVIVSLGCVIGFAVGFYLQRISVTMLIFAAGSILAALFTVPSFPMYRKHPITWLKSKSKVEMKESPTKNETDFKTSKNESNDKVEEDHEEEEE